MPDPTTTNIPTATASGTKSNLPLTTTEGKAAPSLDLTATSQLFGLAMFPPVAEAESLTLSITTEDNNSFTVTTDIQTFLAGNAYDITLTFTTTQIILAGVTIRPWQSIDSDKVPVGSLPEGWDKDIDWTKPVIFDGESNCYIVPSETQVLIPISRAKKFSDIVGAANHPVLEEGEKFYAEVGWYESSSVLGRILCAVGSGPNGYILYETGHGTGNLVINLKKRKTDGTYIVLWSWHIWVTDYNPYINTWTSEYASAATKRTFMDRNLGALANDCSEAARGLYYQWGRKDPFRFSGNIQNKQAESIQMTVENPAVFYFSFDEENWLMNPDNTLWGSSVSKSLYDPCPVGWRVPVSGAGTASPWYGLTTSNGTWMPSDDGWSEGYSWGKNAYYTQAGYLGDILESGGAYWSASSVNNNMSYCFSFTNFMVNTANTEQKNLALSVRCVLE